MATFIVLANYTDQGIRTIKESTKRSSAFAEHAKSAGLMVRDVFWTMGHYDVVVIFDAPDEMTAARALMKLGSLGNIKTQTLRAFSRDEMDQIVGQM